MQGIILHITKVKEEDLIVTLLTQKRLKTLYRFYGARHSSINLGFMIDFIPIPSPKSNISMLREVLHLGLSWQNSRDRFYIWQQFIKLIYIHLKDIIEIDEFYYNLLQKASKRLEKQNPKRVMIESYLELLDYEGRLHLDFNCFICDKQIKKELVLKRSFLPSHYECLFGHKFKKESLKDIFKTKSTLTIDNSEVDILWDILQEGI